MEMPAWSPLSGSVQRHARNILKQKRTLLQLARTSRVPYEVNYRDINESDMGPTASVLWRTGAWQAKKPFEDESARLEDMKPGQIPFKMLDRDGNEAYASDMGLTSSSTHEALPTQQYHRGYLQLTRSEGGE